MAAWDSLVTVGRMVDVEELIDARQVARILGLKQATSVFVYLERYPSMPRPVVDRGDNRAKLWVRGDVEEWQRGRSREA
jgi:glutathione-regulated potassium-efflux system ancillary protein KefG